MLTPASRLYLAIATFGLAGGTAYFFGSDYDLFGTVLFAGLVLVAVTLAVAAVIHRDFRVKVDAAGFAPEDLSPSLASTPSSPWPLLGALGVGLIAVGLIEGVGYVAAGVGVLAIAVVEGAIQSWSEQVSNDPAHNRAIRNRVMLPFEIPIGSTMAAAVGAIALSRVLLTVSTNGAVAVAGVVSVVVLAVGAVLAAKPNLPRQAVTGVVLFGLVALLASGLFGAVNGERDFEHHEEPGVEHAAELEVVPASFTIVAKDIAFDTSDIEAAEGKITLVLDNADPGIPHSIAVASGTEVLAQTETNSGPHTSELSVELVAGSYTFLCTVHPTQMTGNLVVVAPEAPPTDFHEPDETPDDGSHDADEPVTASH